MRIHVTYDRLTHQVVKNLPCPSCGRKTKRQRTFSMTENPLNRNPDGTVRTRAEITQRLRELGDEWQRLPELCTTCLHADES